MNEVMRQRMIRKIRRSYEAAMAMGEKCEICGKMFHPHDEGADVDGTTVWSVSCCGIRHEFIERPVEGWL